MDVGAEESATGEDWWGGKECGGEKVGSERKTVGDEGTARLSGLRCALASNGRR